MTIEELHAEIDCSEHDCIECDCDEFCDEILPTLEWCEGCDGGCFMCADC